MSLIAVQTRHARWLANLSTLPRNFHRDAEFSAWPKEWTLMSRFVCVGFAGLAFENERASERAFKGVGRQSERRGERCFVAATRNPKSYPHPRLQDFPRRKKRPNNTGKQRIAWRQESGGGKKLFGCWATPRPRRRRTSQLRQGRMPQTDRYHYEQSVFTFVYLLSCFLCLCVCHCYFV